MSKVFKFGGASYPINEEISELVPDVSSFETDAVDKRLIKGILASMSEDKSKKKNPTPILLIGPTGCGKTSLIKWLAGKTNNSYRRIQINGSTDIDNFVGRTLLNDEGTYWVDGILTDAMRRGHWLLLDELNAALPEILFILNSILDDDKSLILDSKEGGEVIKPHPNFRLFAAMNPTQDYMGTKELNRSQIDRFSVCELEYLKATEEIKIVSSYAGFDKELGVVGGKGQPIIKRMVNFANIIRDKNKDSEWVSICSTRQLIQWVQLCEYLDIKHAAELAVINKCEKEEREEITDELNKLFKNDDTIKKNEKALEKFKEKEEKDKKEVAAVFDTVTSTKDTSTKDTEVDIEVLKAQRIASELMESDVVVS